MKRKTITAALMALAAALGAGTARADDDAAQDEQFIALLRADGVPAIADEGTGGFGMLGRTICQRLQTGSSLDFLASQVMSAEPGFTRPQATRVVVDARTVYCPTVPMN